MKNKIIFVDYTCGLTHSSIKNIPIGGSEFQFYNLIYNLSKTFEIVCYNSINDILKIDNITYDNCNNFPSDLCINDIIIFQRFLPYEHEVMNKLNNNRIYLWVHDIPHFSIFLKNTDNLCNYYNCNNEKFKNDYLIPIQKNSNINFILNSLACKEAFNKFLSKFNVSIEEHRKHIIYNILYVEEFNNEDNVKIDINNIAYGSAWSKGIKKIVDIFDYIYRKDSNVTLSLMNPGYDYDNFKAYAIQLKEKYGENVIIYGPLKKKDYSKVIKTACCVFAPSFYETFGGVFAESYYLGTPVIADKHSGAVVEIIGKENIVDYNNIDEVYNKYVEIRNDRYKLNINLDEKFTLDYNINLWVKLLKN